MGATNSLHASMYYSESNKRFDLIEEIFWTELNRKPLQLYRVLRTAWKESNENLNPLKPELCSHKNLFVIS